MNKLIKKLIGTTLSILSITSTKNIKAMKKTHEQNFNFFDDQSFRALISCRDSFVNLEYSEVECNDWYDILKSKLKFHEGADTMLPRELDDPYKKVDNYDEECNNRQFIINKHYVVKLKNKPVILIANSYDILTNSITVYQICLHETLNLLLESLDMRQKGIGEQIFDKINGILECNGRNAKKIECYHIDEQGKLSKGFRPLKRTRNYESIEVIPNSKNNKTTFIRKCTRKADKGCREQIVIESIGPTIIKNEYEKNEKDYRQKIIMELPPKGNGLYFTYDFVHDGKDKLYQKIAVEFKNKNKGKSSAIEINSDNEINDDEIIYNDDYNRTSFYGKKDFESYEFEENNEAN